MAWVDFFRAFPPLVLLVLLFAGLPFAGLELGGFACVAIAFFLNTGAYYGEILRAGIEFGARAARSRPARSTGLSRLQAMIYVVLPQAVRNVLPDLLSNTLEVVKLTVARQRGRRARAPVPGPPGAERDLQPDADRGGGDHLFPDAVAGGAAAEPAGESGAGCPRIVFVYATSRRGRLFPMRSAIAWRSCSKRYGLRSTGNSGAPPADPA